MGDGGRGCSGSCSRRGARGVRAVADATPRGRPPAPGGGGRGAQRGARGGQRELREASFTDALTGARNRRFFSTVIEDDVNRTLRVHSTPAPNRPRNCDLIFYIVDIDHFKEINDDFGHDRGDGVLAEVARRLTHVVRDSDRLIRWGGEEFLLISRDADRTRGDVLAGRVMQAVGSEPFDLGGGQKVRRTCSVGWAPFPWYPDSTRTFAFTEVLKLADRAMYLAKQSGRNRSVGVLPAGPYSESAAGTATGGRSR